MSVKKCYTSVYMFECFEQQRANSDHWRKYELECYGDLRLARGVYLDSLQTNTWVARSRRSMEEMQKRYDESIERRLMSTKYARKLARWLRVCRIVEMLSRHFNVPLELQEILARTCLNHLHLLPFDQ